MRKLILITTLLAMAGCAAPGEGFVPELGDGKADFANDVEQRGALEFGSEMNGELAEDFEYHAFEIDAAAGAQLTLEVTQRDTSRDLATVLVLYGPAGEDGARERIAHDFDSGWGLHSRLRGVTLEQAGVHTAIVGARDGFGRGRYNLALTCDNGACTRPDAPPQLSEGDPNTEFMETFNNHDSEYCWGYGRSFYYGEEEGDPSPTGAAEAIREMRIAELELFDEDADNVRVRGAVSKDALDSWLGDTWGYDLATFEGAVGRLGEARYEVQSVTYDYECAASVSCSATIMVALVPEWDQVWTLEFGCGDE